MKKTFRIKRGLDIPLSGSPEQVVSDGPLVKRVALIGPDYLDLRPTLDVAVGDHVKLAQVLFRDRRDPRICFTAPGAGKVAAIHRGEKRVLQAVEIALEGNAEQQFARHPISHLPSLPRELVLETLLSSGLWPALRRRPFGRIPDPDEAPAALFVTAIDTQPLAADPALVIAQRPEDFRNGLQVLSRLTDGPVYLCQSKGAQLPAPEEITLASFSGPHPAGLPGTHIHILAPVSAERCVWHIGYQDVIAAGHLFTTGRILTERIVALSGPGMQRPRLVRTRLGASMDDLLRNELTSDSLRIVSGSVLDGHGAAGPFAFLGRYHLQVTALAEAHKSGCPGWLPLGAGEWSRRLFTRDQRHPFTTAAYGAQRAIYSIGTYEKVMPLAVSASYLLRALASGDTEEAQALGCLELVEDDLALCSFVCPGKNDFGPMLRSVLNMIEKEG